MKVIGAVPQILLFTSLWRHVSAYLFGRTSLLLSLLPWEPILQRSKTGGKWSSSKYNVKVEPAEFTHRLDSVCERKLGIKDEAKQKDV